PFVRAPPLPLPTASAVLLAACAGGSANAPTPATASAAATARPSPSASFKAGPVWVLTPVGLNMRASPDTSAQRLATLQQGVELDVLDRQPGAQSWLKVRAHDSGTVVGW